jgi:hypothetical protein
MVLAMSRRSPPLYRTDHSAYSVQVRILVSDLRFGSLFDRILRWLDARLGVSSQKVIHPDEGREAVEGGMWS